MRTAVGPLPLQHRQASLARPPSAPGRRPVQRVGSANLGKSSSGGSAPLPNAPRSLHPDAVRRRKQAEARKAAAQCDAQTAQQVCWWQTTLPTNLKPITTPAAFQAALLQDGLVVIDFFAPWCSACRRLFPKLMQLAENNPDVVFLKVNGGDTALSKMVEGLGVDKLPYFHFYKDGTLLAHFAANLTRINLLRAELAAHKECAAPSCIL